MLLFVRGDKVAMSQGATAALSSTFEAPMSSFVRSASVSTFLAFAPVGLTELLLSLALELPTCLFARFGSGEGRFEIFDLGF